ncbi:Chromate resistance protein ChrB [Mycobacterium simulans]|uniref:Chromate resistance protein ChrB n=1 Tax=Mycobacterium simulans TaxID=627089 RepID=UPI001CD78BCC|nr:Chromate resistance protein ChrB [Mycobacterium simulans]
MLLSHRLPREPSTPRITLWRKLKELGVAQLADRVAALPADVRTREQLAWLAEEVCEVGGQAGVWLARPATAAQGHDLIAQIAGARAALVALAQATEQLDGVDVPEIAR